MAWASATKWVVGAASMICCTSSGMLSRGVVPPERICSGNSTRMISRPNCGIERATVPKKMPIEVVANRCSAAPVRNSAIEPSIGTCSQPCTTSSSDSAAAVSTTSPIDQTLASMISSGVTGITSRCSTVPCSRSRISAAPVRMIDSMVIWLITSITEPNQARVRLGLNSMCATSSAGCCSSPR